MLYVLFVRLLLFHYTSTGHDASVISQTICYIFIVDRFLMLQNNCNIMICSNTYDLLNFILS